MNNDAQRSLTRRVGELDGWDDDVRWDDDSDDFVPPPLLLSSSQQAALNSAISDGLRERGCDHTLRAAQSWTTENGLDWNTVQAGLEGRGGYCDCEVLLNVGLATS